jgi:hypothetical protein
MTTYVSFLVKLSEFKLIFDYNKVDFIQVIYGNKLINFMDNFMNCIDTMVVPYEGFRGFDSV